MTASYSLGVIESQIIRIHLDALQDVAGEPSLRLPPVVIIRRLETLLHELGITPAQSLSNFGPNDLEDFLYLELEPDHLRKLVEGLPLQARPATVTRILNLLGNAGIHTIEDLLSWSYSELTAIPHMGTGFAEIVNRAVLAEGWHLSPHDQQLPEPPKGDEWVQLWFRQVLRSRLTRESVYQLMPRTSEPLTVRLQQTYIQLMRALTDAGIVRISQLLELMTNLPGGSSWTAVIRLPDTLSHPRYLELSPVQSADRLVRELLGPFGLEPTH